MKKEKNIKWAILTTGWGRNAKDLIEAYSSDKLKKSDISYLIYQDEPCGAKEAAVAAGIPNSRIFRKDFVSAESYQNFIADELLSKNIDYVLLLSFKYIIREDFLNKFSNRIVNIHPSLFPSFLATKTAIQEALDYGVKISGITTHIIDDQIDEGQILCQEPIRFDSGETFESVYPKFAKTASKILLDTISTVENIHFDSNS